MGFLRGARLGVLRFHSAEHLFGTTNIVKRYSPDISRSVQFCSTLPLITNDEIRRLHSEPSMSAIAIFNQLHRCRAAYHRDLKKN